jgi:hypothetical protein
MIRSGGPEETKNKRRRVCLKKADGSGSDGDGDGDDGGRGSGR